MKILVGMSGGVDSSVVACVLKKQGHEVIDVGTYDFIRTHFKGVELSKPEGTYMLFLHCEDYCKAHNLTIDDLIQKGWDVGVAWQQGAPFHDEWGIRMNLAVPHSLVVEAMERLKEHVFN